MLRTMLLAGVLALTAPVAGHAAPVLYDLTMRFVEGPLEGQTATGRFAVDGLTGQGEEVATPGSSPQRLLSFDFSIDGNDYSLTGDDGYPSFPQVGFNFGELTSINYFADLPIPVSMDLNSLSFNTRSITDFSLGTVEASLVPVPAALPLLATALGGLAWWRRRTRTALPAPAVA